MFHNILVPLDGSPFGEHALPAALSLAKKSGAALQIVHVHSLLEATYAEMVVLGGSLDERLRQDEKRYLEKTVQRLRAAGAQKVEFAHKEGLVAASIRDHARASGADLIVMTTHARGAFGRFWLGSVTDELIRDVPCPLLLVHPQAHAADFTEDVAFTKVLTPLDGAPLAEQILPAAQGVARAFAAQLQLLRIVLPVLPATLPVGLGTLSDMAHNMAEDLDKLQAQVKKEATEYLSGIGARLEAQGFRATTHIVEADHPGVGILEFAKSSGADLIALETHGRHGLSRLVLGSVADKVLRGSPLPLLLHKPKH